MTFSTDQLEQMPKKRLAALRKMIRGTATTYPENSPRRRSKFFPDGSAIIAVKGGGTLLVESQPQYEAVDMKAKTSKPRRRRVLPNVVTTS
jgi:hypothetical protein